VTQNSVGTDDPALKARQVIAGDPGRRPLKITFLMAWAYGMGGLVRTTVNTANHFAAAGHDVTLLTFFRHRDEPFFEIDERVTIRSLMDIRKSAKFGRVEKWQRSRPTILTPKQEGMHDQFSLRGDYVLWRALRSLDADVLITTRPAFNIAAAMWAPKKTIVIGEDHLNYTKHHARLRWQMHEWYPRLDAMVTLTDADRQDYDRLLKGATTVRAIGNAVPAGPHPRSTGFECVVVAAGRVTGQKQFQHMITAFKEVVEQRPDWVLRIYGDGEAQPRLRSLIEELRVGDNVFLMGRTKTIEQEFAKASIMAMSSKYEGFPMVILEAFACGLPVVSYTCPRGPAEMITSGHDGLLVQNGSPQALAQGLLELINDEELRRKMGENALDSAARHGIEHVAAQWEDLFAELQTNRRRRPSMPFQRAIRRRIGRALPWSRQRRVRWSK
jgi:glycosyltransferase involved in cell wall biosynthesis